MEYAALPAFATHVPRKPLELAAKPAFAADRCDMEVWNAQDCQHFQHMCPESLWNWQLRQTFAANERGRNVWNDQPRKHVQHMCPEGFWNCKPSQHLLQICVSGMTGICSPASICITCVPKVSGALPAFAADVCDLKAWNMQPCQHFQHMGPESFWNWKSCEHLLQMCV